jgi:hypothetical protein
MTYDFEIYRIANSLLRKHGSLAPLIAAEGAEAQMENGDAVAELVWTAVLKATLECMRTERQPDEQLN